MFSSKSLIYILLVAFIVLCSHCCYAQGEPAHMNREGEKGEEVQGINSGYVVAYGKLLPRPYYVTIRNDTVWINNAAYQPVLTDPNLTVGMPEISDSIRKKAELGGSIQNDYVKYYQTYGLEKAQVMLKEKYLGIPLVSELCYKTFADSIGEIVEKYDGFCVEFTDGTFKILYATTSTSRGGPRIFPPEDPQVKRQMAVNRVKKLLREGWTFLISYSTELNTHENIVEEVKQVLLDLKNGEVSLEVAEEKVKGIIHDPWITQDILDNYESWVINGR